MDKQKLYSKRFLDSLNSEIKEWQEEQIIDDKQAATLHSRYAGLARPASQNKLIRILTILGVLLVGAGVILFFASHWDGISNPVKVGLIITSLLISYALGYFWRYQPGNMPILGTAMILLGAIIFGAGVLLISQIYHLGGKLPEAILIWAIGSILVAWVTKLIPALALSSILFSVWSALYYDSYSNPVYYFPAIMALVFLLTYRYGSPLTAVINILGIIPWLCTLVIASLSDHHGEEDFVYCLITLLAYGVLVYTVAYLHHLADRITKFAYWFRLVGALIIILTLYILSFGDLLEEIKHNAEPNQSLLILFILTFLTIIAWVTISMSKAKDKANIYEKIAAGILLLVCFITISGAHPTFIVNLILFAAIIGIIVMGFFKAEASFINIGLTAFIINLITRYIEYGSSMMDRSLFFIGGGIILLAGGYLLERLRRKLMEKVKQNEGT